MLCPYASQRAADCIGASKTITGTMRRALRSILRKKNYVFRFDGEDVTVAMLTALRRRSVVRAEYARYDVRTYKCAECKLPAKE
jgi:hypothetical protein